MSHQHVGAAELRQLNAGDVPGIGTGIVRREVLRPVDQAELVGVDQGLHRAQRGERRDDRDLYLLEVLVRQREGDRLDQGDAPQMSEIHLPVAGDQDLAGHVHASSTARPGSSLPSRYSREAPPPVEMWVKPDSSMPRVRTAAAESPQPTTENEGEAPMASATDLVPAANGASSNTPIGPFQKTVADAAATSENFAALSGPMSRPSQPSRMPSAPTIWIAASAENASAITTSVGNRILSGLSSSSFRQVSIWSSCSREAPTP